MLGLFALTAASLEGRVLQMVNHGISTGMLFLLFGVIYDRRHTRHIDEFGGLAKPMPVYATLFVIATLASVGLPGTNGFIGEFMVITGTFASNKLGHFNGVQAAGAAFGVILGAVYMLMVVQKMFFGPVTKKENKKLEDMNAPRARRARAARDHGLRHRPLPEHLPVADQGRGRARAGRLRRPRHDEPCSALLRRPHQARRRDVPRPRPTTSDAGTSTADAR